MKKMTEVKFDLFTEVPKFDLFAGAEDRSKTSMSQWEPPSTFEDVLQAIDELDSDSPASIMLETESESMVIMGGPTRFMCVLSNGRHARHFISKSQSADQKSELNIRVSGNFEKLPGRYSLAKDEVCGLAQDFVFGIEANSENKFDVEINKIQSS